MFGLMSNPYRGRKGIVPNLPRLGFLREKGANAGNQTIQWPNANQFALKTKVSTMGHISVTVANSGSDSFFRVVIQPRSRIYVPYKPDHTPDAFVRCATFGSPKALRRSAAAARHELLGGKWQHLAGRCEKHIRNVKTKCATGAAKTGVYVVEFSKNQTN